MHPLARPTSVWILWEGHAVELAASLRTAIQLERICDGWAPLLNKLAQFDTSVIHQLIRVASPHRSDAETLLRSLSTRPLTEVRTAVSDPLTQLCELLLAPTSKTETKAEHSGEQLSWSEGYAQLFGIGTAVLGWSPAQTWAATPAEIVAALETKAKMSAPSDENDKPARPKSAYTPEKLAEIEELGFDPAFDREALHRLKAKG